MTMKGNTKLEEERTAATDAKALLCELTTATARSDRNIFVLRYAANVATTATYQRLESRQSLNELRSQAAKSLNAVCRLLNLRRLDQTSIDEVTQRCKRGWACSRRTIVSRLTGPTRKPTIRG